jgi:hypothetical protein
MNIELLELLQKLNCLARMTVSAGLCGPVEPNLNPVP